MKSLARDLQPVGGEIVHQRVKAAEGESDLAGLAGIPQPGNGARAIDVIERSPESTIGVGVMIGAVGGWVSAGNVIRRSSSAVG